MKAEASNTSPREFAMLRASSFRGLGFQVSATESARLLQLESKLGQRLVLEHPKRRTALAAAALTPGPQLPWLWWSKPFWDPILGWLVTSPPMLEPILVEIGLFTGGTIWILTHGRIFRLLINEDVFMSPCWLNSWNLLLLEI